MERSKFGCFKVFRGNKLLMAIFIVMAFNVSLLSVVSHAATIAQTITPQAPAPVIAQPPKVPIQGTTVIDQKTSNCYFDQYGQMHCPSSGTTSTPAGPLGAACKTASGASGIWVVTSSASSMICATTGDTCYTPSAGIGKVWGTGSNMKCGGKGDYCPSSTGDGKVFDMGGYLSCLGFGSSCTRTLAGAACTGCKVVGAPGNYMSFECAKKYVSCPATALASVQLAPTNGQASAPIQVAMNNITHNDASALYCDYILKDVGKLTSYSIPCVGAYASTTDARYRSCTVSGSKVWVKCDSPGIANGKVNAPVLNGLVGDMTIVKNAVAANFRGSANDAARQNAICNYGIDGFIFQTKIPCISLRKAASANTYYCY